MTDNTARKQDFVYRLGCACDSRLLLFICLAASESNAEEFPEPLGELIRTACIDCHDGESAEGGLDLASLPFTLDDRNWNQFSAHGVDLSGLLFDQKPVGVRTLFWRMGDKKCVREGRHKLCVLPNQPPALYDLTTDLGETTNIAANHPKLVSRLQRALANWEQTVDQSALNWK